MQKKNTVGNFPFIHENEIHEKWIGWWHSIFTHLTIHQSHIIEIYNSILRALAVAERRSSHWSTKSFLHDRFATKNLPRYRPCLVPEHFEFTTSADFFSCLIFLFLFLHFVFNFIPLDFINFFVYTIVLRFLTKLTNQSLK